MTKLYKIRDEHGHFSQGIIRETGWYDKQKWRVKFTPRGGKIWTDEKLIKNHLLKCAQRGIPYGTWEIIEVVYNPTKPVVDWFDSLMLAKVIKGK